MANTYTQILYHVVFSTKERKRAINETREDDLYKYLWGIHKNLKCHLYRIGGVKDHIHILTSLHPTVALSKYIETTKTSSTDWIRREKVYGSWPGWQDGYGAFTVSWPERDDIIEYIKRQNEHHQDVRLKMNTRSCDAATAANEFPHGSVVSLRSTTAIQVKVLRTRESSDHYVSRECRWLTRDL